MKLLNKQAEILITGSLQDATVNIYSLGNPVAVFSGITDVNGKVVKSLTDPSLPLLSYNDYTVEINKCDYDPIIEFFSIPDTTILNLTAGCSSAITTHAAVNVSASVHPNALSRKYFPAPIVNNWSNEPYIDDDNNATLASHSSSAAGSVYYITYDLGSVKNFMLGGLYQLYNSNAVLTVGMRVQISDDDTTWYTVSDVSHSVAATLTYNLNLISRAKYIRFEAYYVNSTGARSVSILDINLMMS